MLPRITRRTVLSGTRSLVALSAAAALLVAAPVAYAAQSATPKAGSTAAKTGASAAPACTVSVHPSSNVNAVVANSAAGAVICFAPGTYRLTSALSPRPDQTLRGGPGVVLSGTRRVNNWVASGKLFEAHGHLPAPYSGAGVCERANSTSCQLAEDLFVNGHPLRRVDSLAAVTAGTYYADYSANEIAVASRPARNTAEIGTTRTAINSGSPGVTIDHFQVQGFASIAQQGAIVVGPSWTVEHCNVRYNHGVGIMIAGGDHAKLIKNYVHDNGQLGVGQWRSQHTVIRNNTIRHNNIDGFWKADWESGGIKLTYSSATITHNTVKSNLGVGVWADVQDDGVTISHNTILNNAADGVRYEISYNGKIVDNVVRHNALGMGRGGGTSLYSGAGIDINTSSDITISGNTLRGNLNGISTQLRNRGSGPKGAFTLAHVQVTGNFVDLSRGGASSGMVENVGDPQAMQQNDIVFQNNTYVLAHAGQPSFSVAGRNVSWQGWQANGQDTSGRTLIS